VQTGVKDERLFQNWIGGNLLKLIRAIGVIGVRLHLILVLSIEDGATLPQASKWKQMCDV
jgi:hypothetical protein